MGTFSQIRNKYGHIGAKKKIADSYNHCMDLLKFISEFLICILAMKLMGINDANDEPAEWQDRQVDESEKDSYLKQVVRIIHQ